MAEANNTRKNIENINPQYQNTKVKVNNKQNGRKKKFIVAMHSRRQ